MQQNEQVYKCADPARQKMHWFQKKKLKGHIITILIGLNLNIKGWIFLKKISFEPVRKMD